MGECRSTANTLSFLRHVRSGQRSVCLILILFNKLLLQCQLVLLLLLLVLSLSLLLHFLCDVTSAAVWAGLQDSLSPNCTIMPSRTGRLSWRRVNVFGNFRIHCGSSLKQAVSRIIQAVSLSDCRLVLQSLSQFVIYACRLFLKAFLQFLLWVFLQSKPFRVSIW